MSTPNKPSAQPTPEETRSVLNERMQQAVIENADESRRSKLFTAIRDVVNEMRSSNCCSDVQIYLMTVGAVALLNPTDAVATNRLMGLVCTNCGISKMETNPAALPDLDRVAAETRKGASPYVPPKDLTDGPSSEL